MNHTLPPDVQRLIAAQLASGRYASEEEVLRDALLVLRDVDEEAGKVQAAIDEWKNGDQGIPLDEAFAWAYRRAPQTADRWRQSVLWKCRRNAVPWLLKTAR